MTARTHDLFAFTGLTLILTNIALPSMSLATALVAFAAIFMGGMFPDLDEPSAQFWRKLPAGSVIGRIVSPLFGSHRFLTHSLLGIVLGGYGSRLLLNLIGNVLLVNMDIVWVAFMVGVVSHLFADALTREGVPLLFPIPWHFGLPPLRALRIKTGGMAERGIIFPLLLLTNGWLYYMQYNFVIVQFKQFLH